MLCTGRLCYSIMFGYYDVSLCSYNFLQKITWFAVVYACWACQSPGPQTALDTEQNRLQVYLSIVYRRYWDNKDAGELKPCQKMIQYYKQLANLNFRTDFWLTLRLTLLSTIYGKMWQPSLILFLEIYMWYEHRSNKIAENLRWKYVVHHILSYI